MKEVPTSPKNFVYFLRLHEKRQVIQKTQNLSSLFPNLQRLRYKALSSDIFSFSGIGDLHNLVRLELEIDCDVLFVQNLTNLKHATVINNGGLANYDEVENLTKFQPHSKLCIENLSSLESLQVIGWKMSRPLNVPKLRQLVMEKTLILGEDIFETDKKTPNYPLLEELRIRQENNIRRVHQLPNLHTLVFSNESWMDLCHENRSTFLHCSSISDLPSLIQLIVRGRSYQSNLDNNNNNPIRISNLPSLELLHIDHRIILLVKKTEKLKELILNDTTMVEGSSVLCTLELRHLTLINSVVPFDINACIMMESIHINFSMIFPPYTRKIHIDPVKLVHLKTIDVFSPRSSTGAVIQIGGSPFYPSYQIARHDISCNNLEELYYDCDHLCFLPPQMDLLRVLVWNVSKAVTFPSYYWGAIGICFSNINKYKNLERLELIFKTRVCNDADFAISGLKKLRSLSIKSLVISTILIKKVEIGELFSLEELSLSGIKNVVYQRRLSLIAPSLQKAHFGRNGSFDIQMTSDHEESICLKDLVDFTWEFYRGMERRTFESIGIDLKTITTLKLFHSNLSNEEVRMFPNVRVLVLDFVRYTSENPIIENMKNLEFLYIQNPYYKKISIQNLPSLTDLFVHSAIDPKGNSRVTWGQNLICFLSDCSFDNIDLRRIETFDVFNEVGSGHGFFDRYLGRGNTSDERYTHKITYRLNELPKLKRIHHDECQCVYFRDLDGFAIDYLPRFDFTRGPNFFDFNTRV